MQRLVIGLCLLTFLGCNSDNTVSSVRSVERLIIGTWVIPNPFIVEDGIIDFADWQHIMFHPDGTFVAPWGISGPRLHEYKGNYWVKGEYIGSRGVGGNEGEGRTHVQFGQLTLTEWADPEALGLQITEVLPEYMATLGLGLVDEMSSGEILKALDRLNDKAPPADAMGRVIIYHKAEREPIF